MDVDPHPPLAHDRARCHPTWCISLVSLGCPPCAGNREARPDKRDEYGLPPRAGNNAWATFEAQDFAVYPHARGVLSGELLLQVLPSGSPQRTGRTRRQRSDRRSRPRFTRAREGDTALGSRARPGGAAHPRAGDPQDRKTLTLAEAHVLGSLLHDHRRALRGNAIGYTLMTIKHGSPPVFSGKVALVPSLRCNRDDRSPRAWKERRSPGSQGDQPRPRMRGRHDASRSDQALAAGLGPRMGDTRSLAASWRPTGGSPSERGREETTSCRKGGCTVHPPRGRTHTKGLCRKGQSRFTPARGETVSRKSPERWRLAVHPRAGGTVSSTRPIVRTRPVHPRAGGNGGNNSSAEVAACGSPPRAGEGGRGRVRQ